VLKETSHTPVRLREPGNPDSYDVAPDSTLHVLTEGWGASELDDGREIFFPEQRPEQVKFEPPTERPKGVYTGDSERFPLHAAAAADDVEGLLALLGPVEDYDPTYRHEILRVSELTVPFSRSSSHANRYRVSTCRRDILEPIPARKARELRVATIEDCDEDGRTALLVAVSQRSLEAVGCLLERNANITASDPHFRWGVLHESPNLRHPSHSHLYMLIATVCPLHFRWGVLHESVEGGDWPEMIELLLKSGAHPLARSKAGRTAVELCDPKNGRTLSNGRARPKSVALLKEAAVPFARREQERKQREYLQHLQAKRDAFAEEKTKVRQLPNLR
jgi:hypothetical protein